VAPPTTDAPSDQERHRPSHEGYPAVIPVQAGGSLAGNDSHDASSTHPPPEGACGGTFETSDGDSVSGRPAESARVDPAADVPGESAVSFALRLLSRLAMAQGCACRSPETNRSPGASG